MYIYFCGSIRGGRHDVEIYQKIVKKLQNYGEVLTDHVSRGEMTDQGESPASSDEKVIHDRDLKWLRQSDLIVAEVTQPSLGVGYELGRAVAMGKRIFCLFRPSSRRSLSAMVRGAHDGELFIVQDYSEEELEKVLEDFFTAPHNSPPVQDS